MHMKKLEDQAENMIEKNQTLTEENRKYIVDAVKQLKLQKGIMRVSKDNIKEEKEKNSCFVKVWQASCKRKLQTKQEECSKSNNSQKCQNSQNSSSQQE